MQGKCLFKIGKMYQTEGGDGEGHVIAIDERLAHPLVVTFIAKELQCPVLIGYDIDGQYPIRAQRYMDLILPCEDMLQASQEEFAKLVLEAEKLRDQARTGAHCVVDT